MTGSVTSPDSKVAEVIASSGRDISEAIAQLETTLSSLLTISSSITLTHVLFAIFVAFIGALSAYLFNLFHWRMVKQKQKVSRIGVTLGALINDLESLAVDYWIQDYKKKDQQKIDAIEISIKSKMRLILRYIRIIVPELKTHNTTLTKQKLEDFGLEIFDLVTGDEFESITRKASKPKAMQISNQCSDVRAIILSLD